MNNGSPEQAEEKQSAPAQGRNCSSAVKSGYQAIESGAAAGNSADVPDRRDKHAQAQCVAAGNEAHTHEKFQARAECYPLSGTRYGQKHGSS